MPQKSSLFAEENVLLEYILRPADFNWSKFVGDGVSVLQRSPNDDNVINVN